jgi:outer membrane assembly lipoprotein YfiO
MCQSRKYFLWIGFLILAPALSPAMGPNIFSKDTLKKPNFKEKDQKKAPRKNPLADKPHDELVKFKSEALAKKDIPAAIKCLDALIGNCKESQEMGALKLELADLYLEQKEYEKAEKVYYEFVLLYPSAQRCDYAFHKEIIAGFQLTLSHDRDQTKTENVLKRCKQFIADHSQSSYMEIVVDIATQCRQKLLDHEIYVYNYYFNNKCFKAAQSRLDGIAKEHLPGLPQEKPRYLELSISLAQVQGNTHAVLLAQMELAEQFPTHVITQRLVADAATIKDQLAAFEQSALALKEPVKVAAATPPTESTKT